MTDVTVTQEDRDAAADLAGMVYGNRIADRIRSGEIKRHHFIDAFARQRQSSTEEVERLRAERDFLLARAGHAGSVHFGDKGRWTGASSNALVEVAFGGENDDLPFDSGDLAACYRALMRLPKHLLSDAVFEQLERGEQHVGADCVAMAREASGWPGRTALTGVKPHDA